MTTIIERDSSGPILLLVIVGFLVLGGGGYFGYSHGLFGGKTVIENNKTIITAPAAPAPAPGK